MCNEIHVMIFQCIFFKKSDQSGFHSYLRITGFSLLFCFKARQNLYFYNTNPEGKVPKMIEEYGEGSPDVGGIQIRCARKVAGIRVLTCPKVYKALGGYWPSGCKL